MCVHVCVYMCVCMRELTTTVRRMQVCVCVQCMLCIGVCGACMCIGVCVCVVVHACA